MSPSLENPFLQLSLADSNDLSWSVTSRQFAQTGFENIRMEVTYRPAKTRWWRASRLENSTQASALVTDSLLGRLDQLALVGTSSDRSLRLTLTFALPARTACLLWKVEIENVSTGPVEIGRIELLRLDPVAMQEAEHPARFSLGPQSTTNAALAFFSNGWQSWNYSGAYGPLDRFRATRLGPFTSPMRVNAGRPRPRARGHLVSDMFAVLGDRKQRLGALVGFLSQQEHFGTIETHLRGEASDLRMWAAGDGARLDPGRRMTTDWAYLSFLDLDQPDPLGNYYESVARWHGLLTDGADPLFAAVPTGWCSWYNFFGNVTASDILANLEAAHQLADRLPFEVIQIDDGFETKVGDWFSFKPAFPDGLAPLAEAIQAGGFTPGVWLAPFTVVPSSKLAARHPEWLLRGRLNRPVNAGYSSWGEFTTALDLTHPGALQYTQELVQTAAEQWGFPYLKLDFLYAGALPGKHLDATRTRAQILRAGLQALRDCLDPKITLLGCGCPLGPAIGLVDAMRISADVAERWNPAFSGVEAYFVAEPDYPSTRNALQNILTRSGMHRRWWINDPDCLLVRPDSKMTLAEIQSLATAISLSGGSFFLSDDLPALPEQRIRLAASLLPVLPGRVWVIDWFDSARPTRLRLDLHGQSGDWSLLAYFNWQDQAADLTLDLASFGLEPGQAYWGRDFWRGETYLLGGPSSRPQILKDTAPHGVRLLALRPVREDQPCYLGGSLHISQGLEVVGWEERPQDELNIQLERPGLCQGEVHLYLPGEPGQASLNGSAIDWRAGGKRRYIFQVDFDRTAELRLTYDRANHAHWREKP